MELIKNILFMIFYLIFVWFACSLPYWIIGHQMKKKSKAIEMEQEKRIQALIQASKPIKTK